MKWEVQELKWPLLMVTALGCVAFIVTTFCGILVIEESPAPCCGFCLLMLLIAVTGIAWQSKPVFPDNRCHQCDYDLTGNVSGICPECGTPIPTPPSQQELDALAEKTRRRWALVRERVLLVSTILAGLFCAYTFATSVHHPLGLKGTIRNSLPAFLVSVVLGMGYIDQRRRR